MTPNRRLDQLEQLMADSLQKIDRLIEGQGQLVEIATRADQKADTTAKGVANLTLKVNQIANDQTEFRQQVNQQFENIGEQFQRVNQQFENVGEQFQRVDRQFENVGEQFQQVNQKIDTEIGSLRQEMNQRFDQLVMLIQERLK